MRGSYDMQASAEGARSCRSSRSAPARPQGIRHVGGVARRRSLSRCTSTWRYGVSLLRRWLRLIAVATASDVRPRRPTAMLPAGSARYRTMRCSISRRRRRVLRGSTRLHVPRSRLETFPASGRSSATRTGASSISGSMRAAPDCRLRLGQPRHAERGQRRSGSAAACFVYTEEVKVESLWPSVAETLAFIDEYDEARGEPFTARERTAVHGAAVYLRRGCSPLRLGVQPPLRSRAARGTAEALL